MPNLIQLTDTHLFDDPAGSLYGVNTRQSLQSVLDDIQTRVLALDAVLVTGDCVHDEGESAYRSLGQMLSVLKVPVHYLPGNHDNAAVLQSVLHNAPINGLHHFILQSWLVVLLDSAVPGKVEGEVSSSTLQRLEAVLQQHADKPILVAVHHHAVNVGSQWMDQIGITNGDDLLQLLNQFNNVRLLINGHIHQPLDALIGQVRVLGTPSTCFQFEAGKQQASVGEAPPAYRYLQLHANGGFDTQLFFPGQD